MPSSPPELLQLSKDLAALGGSETWQRCVVSRAYYASLHATNATFPKTAKDVRIDGESSHAEIIGRAVVYGKSLKPGRSYASQIAQALPRLRRLRNFADYDLDETLSPREYQEVLLRAERIMQQCVDVERLRAESEGAKETPPLPFSADGSSSTVDQTVIVAGPKPFKPTLVRVK
jgi:hypothetical protein